MTACNVFEIIVRSCREVLPHLIDHEFGPDDRLVELGANSIDRAEIVTMVLDALSLPIPRTEVHGPRNIGELASFLEAKLRLP